MGAPIYKQFTLFRTVFIMLFAALFLSFSGVGHAETDPNFTVEGVEVDVKAENAVKAREKALAEAQVKAYQMLAERFLSPEEFKTFKAPDADTVSYLVQDYEVTNEQLSTKRYKGIYTIRFRPNAMKTQMASQGKTLEAPRKPVLVLPFYQDSSIPLLWSDTNPFLMAWKNIPADKSMIQPTVLPLGDAQDIQQISDEQGLQYDPMEVQGLANRYGADDVAILMASPESTGTTQGRLAVAIYNNGFEGPVFVQKVIFDQLPEETQDALFTRAALKIKSLLRENWKANAAYNPNVPVVPQQQTQTTTVTTYQQPAPQTAPVPYTRPALGTSKTYNAHARFASVQDWVRMKNTLDRTYGVQAVSIKSIKPREASLDIMYAGDLNALQLALQNAGIIMRGSPSGALEIYTGGMPPQSNIYGR